MFMVLIGRSSFNSNPSSYLIAAFLFEGSSIMCQIGRQNYGGFLSTQIVASIIAVVIIILSLWSRLSSDCSDLTSFPLFLGRVCFL